MCQKGKNEREWKINSGRVQERENRQKGIKKERQRTDRL